MITTKRILFGIHRTFEKIAIARVNSVLLGMGRAKVEEFGYSYDLLKQGPSAWPWHESTQYGAKAVAPNNAVVELSESEIPLYQGNVPAPAFQEKTAA